MRTSPLIAVLVALAGSTAQAQSRPTDTFRKEHAAIREHLEHLGKLVGELPAAAPSQQRKTMQTVVGFFTEHIRPHAEWEEKFLYPAVDRRACTGKEPFTATMRYEHKVVGRWIAELERNASAKTPDVRAFARRSDNLLGLLGAHFEEEEEVLLPILDRTMTPEQFKKEIPPPAEHAEDKGAHEAK